jgi:hypothetical protein
MGFVVLPLDHHYFGLIEVGGEITAKGTLVSQPMPPFVNELWVEFQFFSRIVDS